MQKAAKKAFFYPKLFFMTDGHKASLCGAK